MLADVDRCVMARRLERARRDERGIKHTRVSDRGWTPWARAATLREASLALVVTSCPVPDLDSRSSVSILCCRAAEISRVDTQSV